VEDVVDGENGEVIPLLDDGTALRAAVERVLDHADAVRNHNNPYKDKIVDHEQQAAELYEFLSTVGRRKPASVSMRRSLGPHLEVDQLV
jgi:hypothetical protein